MYGGAGATISRATSGGGLATTIVSLASVAGAGWVARGAALAAAEGAGVLPWRASTLAVSAALVVAALGLARGRMRDLEGP